MFWLKYYWILYIYCTSAGIFSMFLFIHKQCENAREWALKEFDLPHLKEYDFIVVGGGTAGSIVASRLSEDANHSVLLIEAGGESSFIHDIPLSAPMIQQSVYDWQYETVPQDNACLGMRDQVSCWPMGKIVGGTSRLNYMIYLRGHERDYASWANGEDWTSSDVLFYFKRSENQQGHFRNDTKHHGTQGSVYVTDLSFKTELASSLLNAGEELGYPTKDLNILDAKATPGMMETQVTAHDGARWSSEHTLKRRLVSSGRKSNNLHLMTNSIVTKVLLLNKFEAQGVVVRRDGHLEKIFAKKSVILSAGTIGTPKILMLSGIGPSAHLRQHNIEPYVNLPVGENLQDHVTTGLDLVLLNWTLPLSSTTVLKTPIAAYQYLVHGDGVLTHPGCETIGLFHMENDTLPDIQLMALPAGLSTDAGVVLRRAMCISDKLWNGYFSSLVSQQVITILPTLLHPKSRGTVRLRSSNPNDPPVIDPRYLTEKCDANILIKGIRLIEKLVKTKSMSRLGARINNRPMPSCESHEFGTDPYWECYIRQLTLTAYHPVGTCKMGRDPGSVVNYDLSVHNTHRLHIIDASIMPTMPSANINAAVMMIAEKGADILKYKWFTHFNKCWKMDIFVTGRTTYKHS
ncbi:hypothetical protein AAG570_011904 [Ranatra chinensis]|uniref:Glucose-methanol-choline oxidoreductase N-terminal domain-containing protein n=1 Tax=Ranatra chinensis TaxID=642074 RepID=A0ABD0YTP7_9HEMI